MRENFCENENKAEEEGLEMWTMVHFAQGRVFSKHTDDYRIYVFSLADEKFKIKHLSKEINFQYFLLIS